MRFAMTARTLARIEEEGKVVNDITAKNVMKVTRYRKEGDQDLRKIVDELRDLKVSEPREKGKFGGKA